MLKDKKRPDGLKQLFNETSKSHKEKSNQPESNVIPSEDVQEQLTLYKNSNVSEEKIDIYNIHKHLDIGYPSKNNMDTYLYFYDIDNSNHPTLFVLLYLYNGKYSLLETSTQNVENIINLIFKHFEEKPVYQGHLTYNNKYLMCYNVKNLKEINNYQSKYISCVMFEILNLKVIKNTPVDSNTYDFFMQYPDFVYLYEEYTQLPSPIICGLNKQKNYESKNKDVYGYHLLENQYQPLTQLDANEQILVYLLYLKHFKIIYDRDSIEKLFSETEYNTLILHENEKVFFICRNLTDIVHFYNY